MASPPSFALFETAIGTCAIAWGARGVIGTQLPEHDDEDTRRRMTRRFAGAIETAPTPEVRQAIAGIQSHLAGARADLTQIALDPTGLEPFQRRVYDIARTIAPGATMTYGAIALELGEPRASQAVGVALARNPFPIVVPCHRVLAAGGKLGGFSASGGVATKQRLLAIEGVTVPAKPSVFDVDKGDDPAEQRSLFD